MPDVVSRIDININLLRDLLQTNPENSSDYRELLVLWQEQRILQREREEIFSQLEDTRQEGESVFERGITIGFTALSLFPFTISSLLVFIGRIQWAILTTGIGLTVMVLVLSIYLYSYLGEQIRIGDEQRSIRQDLEDNFRRIESILNQTDDIISRLATRG